MAPLTPHPAQICSATKTTSLRSAAPHPVPAILAFLLLPWGGAAQAPRQCCSVPGGIAHVRIALPSSKRISRYPHGGLTGLRGSLGGSTEGLLWLMRKGAATLEDEKQPLMRESRWQTEGHNLTCRKRFLFPFTPWGGSGMRQEGSVPLRTLS